MITRLSQILETKLRDLHPNSIENTDEIRRVLEGASVQKTKFYRGLNAEIDLETATIELLSHSSIVLRTSNFNRRANVGLIFLRFDFEERPYFFATHRVTQSEGDRLIVALPRSLFLRERRDRVRRHPNVAAGDTLRVEISGPVGFRCEAEIRDRSPSGLGLDVPKAALFGKKMFVTARYLDGRDAGQRVEYVVQGTAPIVGRVGWTRIGLLRADVALRKLIDIEFREDFEPRDLLGMESAANCHEDQSIIRARARRISVPGERQDLEELAYLVDSWGPAQGATAVVISNGWGQTKEAVLPLARTIVETFRSHRQPIEVIRFDGIRKRGESFTDPECRFAGGEAQNFVFSQGVRDVDAIVRHVRQSTDHGAARVILISFSASAIEARKAVARDAEGAIDAWISVVGAPDLQSMARSISGGVDFVDGHERGVMFGVQELLGVRVNIDRMAADAVRHEMSFIEDSRRDLQGTSIPVTWFHGRYDAWVDITRVRDILSCGDFSRRRLVVLPTGHQLKASKQADFAFRMIAREVGLLAFNRNLEPVSPSPRNLRRQRLAEARRIPRERTNLHSFWKDYLVGRDRSLGIELLTAGSAYKEMMAAQIAALDIRPGNKVADLGSGTGAFPLAIAADPRTPDNVTVFALDYVADALDRTRKRLSSLSDARGIRFSPIESNLDVDIVTRRIPLADHSVDRVIASLFISYLERPGAVMREIFRVLKPGGRVVASSLRRDADIGRLYVESFAELQAARADLGLPELENSNLIELSRNFLNDAAKLLELEDAGTFQFMDPDDLSSLAVSAGFEDVAIGSSLGAPAQAILLSARRPIEHKADGRPQFVEYDESRKRALVLNFSSLPPMTMATWPRMKASDTSSTERS